jgi:pimeloyl-ACP methyl ester carboxylesterase
LSESAPQHSVTAVVTINNAQGLRSASFQEVTIGYEVDGAAEGTPIILLHGFPDSPRTWDGIVGPLTDSGFLIVRPYIRGHGPTVVNPGHPVSAETSALASDVVLLADFLGLRKFHLVGSDWGCRAACALAVLHPERVHSMVTLGTGYNEVTPIAELSMEQTTAFWYQWLFLTDHGHTLLRDSTEPLCRHLWRTWSPHWNFSDDEFNQAALSFRNPQFVETVLHYYRYRWGNAPGAVPYQAAQSRVESMPCIVVPTTHIQGLNDWCTRPETARRWESHIRLCRRVELAGVGHFPQREVPGLVAREIVAAAGQPRRDR